MLANPSALAPTTIKDQGHLLGEIIADLVLVGKPITEILTEILSFGPVSLREAIYMARHMQSTSHPLRNSYRPPAQPSRF